MQYSRSQCNSTAAEFPDRRCSAGSLSSADNDNITEALTELAENNPEAADFVADYPNRQNYLGLSGKELPLNENSMKKALDQGKLIVCSMRPGDFTTSGHYILLYDYDDTGFCIKDPNRVSNSSRTWDYATLSPQIKNLWAISSTGF